MGIETIVRCDYCNRVIEKDEDFISIEVRYEMDANQNDGKTDVRKTKGGVFCGDDGTAIWATIDRVVFPKEKND